VLAFNRGTGLNWTNSATPDEQALLPQLLIDGMNLYLRTDTSAEELFEEEQASLQGNVFKTLSDAGVPLFKLLNIRNVQFSGNTCHAQTTYGSVGEIESVTQGVVANNLVQTSSEVSIMVRKMSSGVIIGNNGNAANEVTLSGQIEHGFNIPQLVFS
jgi:hypothetical protein